MSSDDQNLFAVLVRSGVVVVIDDEDVLENRSVLQDCEDWDSRFFYVLGSHCKEFGFSFWPNEKYL